VNDSFQSRLLSAYPQPTWATLVRGIGEGVRIADDVQRSTRFLSTLVGLDQRGLLRRAGIMWRVQMLCQNGELPFRASEVKNTNGSSHLLSIVSGPIELHIVRTDDADAFPDEAPIRQDRRLTNIPDLFEDGKLIPLADLLKDVPQLYGWLSWGATKRGALTHVCLGMPEKEEDRWLAHRDILLAVLASRERDEVGADERNKSVPNPADLLKFREEIVRQLESDEAEQGNDPNDD
jgi:hypothetical protein